MSQTHYCLIWTALQDSSSESWLSKNDSLSLRQNVISKIQHLFHADIVITVVFSKGKQGKGIQLPFLWVVSYKTQTTGVAKGKERGRRKTNTELLSITKKNTSFQCRLDDWLTPTYEVTTRKHIFREDDASSPTPAWERLSEKEIAVPLRPLLLEIQQLRCTKGILKSFYELSETLASILYSIQNLHDCSSTSRMKLNMQQKASGGSCFSAVSKSTCTMAFA